MLEGFTVNVCLSSPYFVRKIIVSIMHVDWSTRRHYPYFDLFSENLHSRYFLTPLISLFVAFFFPHTSPLIPNSLPLISSPLPPPIPSPPSPLPPSPPFSLPLFPLPTFPLTFHPSYCTYPLTPHPSSPSLAHSPSSFISPPSPLIPPPSPFIPPPSPFIPPPPPLTPS